MADLVRQLINFVYDESLYIDKIKVQELKSFSGSHVGWRAQISLHVDERPLDIAFDGCWKEFLTRLEDRLHKDHLNTTDYFDGHKYLPYNPPCTNYIEYHPHDCPNSIKYNEEENRRLSDQTYRQSHQ